MTPEQFCYWLQGFVEIHGNTPSDEEWVVIKDHIKTVFHKVTPNKLKPIPDVPHPFPTWQETHKDNDLHRWPNNPYNPPDIIC
jgi:hypothetical protein